jgi:TPP-dependent pyruvate/acetoin dehydrogenase alpha subunit
MTTGGCNGAEKDVRWRQGGLTPREIEDLQKTVNEIVDDAAAFAEASPEPPADWLTTDVYKD